MRGVEAVRQLVNVFYDPNFSVGAFLRLHPRHQSRVTRILIGDVFEPDFTSMFEDMAAFAAAGGGKTDRSAGGGPNGLRPHPRPDRRLNGERGGIHDGDGDSAAGVRGPSRSLPAPQRLLVPVRRQPVLGLPIGLTYHILFSAAVVLAMWWLVRSAWPAAELDRLAAGAAAGRPLSPGGRDAAPPEGPA